ncbi:MAG: hypothetical protein K2I89_03430 [Muribaculaceae bacterium]|nr:hypothetical protein [Muribaculaceae bacterium]
MTANEIIQWFIVGAILILCIAWLLKRLRRRNRCVTCDSTNCPIKNNSTHSRSRK